MSGSETEKLNKSRDIKLIYLMKKLFLCSIVILCTINCKLRAQNLCGASSINLTQVGQPANNPAFICLPVCTSSVGTGCAPAVTIQVEVTRPTPFASPGFSGAGNVFVSSTTTTTVSATVTRYTCTVRSNDPVSNNDWTAGSVNFNYTDPVPTCGCSGTRSVAINKIGTYPDAVPITGPTCVAANSQFVYSIRPRYTVNGSNGDFYTWAPTTYPTGVTETYRAGDASSLTLSFGSAFTGPLNLSVVPGKCNSAPLTKIIRLPSSSGLTVSTNGTLPSGTGSICIPAASVIDINLIANATGLTPTDYIWSWTSSPLNAFTIVSFSNNTAVIKPTVANCPSGASGSITVTATPIGSSNCSSLAPGTFGITRLLPAVGAIASFSPTPLVNSCIAFGADGQGVPHEFTIPNVPCNREVDWTPPFGWIRAPYSANLPPPVPPATPANTSIFRMVPTSLATVGNLTASTCSGVTYTRTLGLTIKRTAPVITFSNPCCINRLTATFTIPTTCTVANYRYTWTHTSPNGFGTGISVRTGCGLSFINGPIAAGTVTCAITNCSTAECVNGCTITDAGSFTVATAISVGAFCCRLAVDGEANDQEVKESSFGVSEISIFPNPVKNKASVNVSVISDDLGVTISEIMLYSTTGKLALVKQVDNESKTSLNLTGLAKGVYTAIILTNQKPAHKQIIIE